MAAVALQEDEGLASETVALLEVDGLASTWV